MIFNHLTRAVLLLALLLVARQGLVRRSLSFVAYLVAVLACGSLMAFWPRTFYTWAFWAGSRDLYALLKVLVAVEMGAHVFQAFPGARPVARALTFTFLFGLGVLVVGIHPEGTVIYPAVTREWQDWRTVLNVGTIWLFVSLALLSAWYNLPLDRWHRALLAGFTVQLVLGTLVLARWKTFSASGMLDPLVASWWVYSAWAYARAPKAVPVRGRAAMAPA